MKKIFVVLAAVLLLAIMACSGGGNDAATSGSSAINSRNEVSATITASGGTVESTDPESKMFHAKIVIPQGALDKDTVISLIKIDQAVALPDDTIEGGVVIEFGPDGTVFNKNIVITIPYDDADNDGIVDYTDIPEDQLSVIYWDSSAKQWTKVDSIISRDTVNNTITFETNHFSKYTTSGTKGTSDSKISIFTIDGLDFDRTYKGLLSGVDANYPARTAYLCKGIEETGLVKKSDCYTFGGTNPDESWSGDANKTSDYINELIIMLQAKAKKATEEGKRFIVVTHSWGTQLGAIGLDRSGVEPDLFITLSDPEGSTYVDSKSYSNYWFTLLPPVTVIDAEGLVDAFIKDHGVGAWTPPINFKTKKWINYWDVGDIISGPLKSKYISNSIEDRTVIDSTKRNYDTTKKVHAITSLSEDFWTEENGVSKEEGKAFRDKVIQDIIAVLDTVSLKSIQVTPNSATISIGGNQQYTATAYYTNGSSQDITMSCVWTSSNWAVAIVVAFKGLATGIVTGSTQITAIYGGISGTATLHVSRTLGSTVYGLHVTSSRLLPASPPARLLPLRRGQA